MANRTRLYAATFCLLLIATCWAGQDKVYVAKNDGEQAIGHVRWEIYDVATRKIIGKGERTVRLKDVQVRAKGLPGQALYAKRIPLSHHFVLEMAETPEARLGEQTGFGLNVKRDDIRAFCWEWFQVKSPTRATKLQEKGELLLKMAKVGAGWEVTYTEFLTDVSARVDKALRSDTTWRVNILKGSKITWPSLVNGKVVPNK